jgi:hypothetical protein
MQWVVQPAMLKLDPAIKPGVTWTQTINIRGKK